MKIFSRGSALVLLLCCLLNTSQAQTKVFKEVSDEIASTMRVIVQDNSLVGYLVFTRLEAVNKDSFAYKISIMDENLNDIGVVNFREKNLTLSEVAFEQDVLCLVYLKSNVKAKSSKSKRDRESRDDDANYVFTQFINLDGKIIKTNAEKIEVEKSGYYYYAASSRITVTQDGLKQGIQLKNIPRKGFVLFYGDQVRNYLTAYTPKGEKMWEKHPSQSPKNYVLLTTPTDVYALTSDVTNSTIDYELSGYSAADGSTYDNYALKDKKGNNLTVLAFENDIATGSPYICGYINNGQTIPTSVRSITKSPYVGVFTIDISGGKRSDYKANYSYWTEGKNNAIAERGRLSGYKEYPYFERSFRDFQGNTYFAGSLVKKKTKVGTIIATLVTIPMLVAPFIALTGFTKFRGTDALLLKQTPKGQITLENTIASNKTSYQRGSSWASSISNKDYHIVTNSNTKNNYLIVDDQKDISIYNIQSKKVIRTIPHKDGNVKTYVFPAKDGSIMVSEYNRKERYTRLSIESL